MSQKAEEKIMGASFIFKQLEKIGVTKIFGIPGLHIDSLYIASNNSSVEIITCCHELSAGYMADGYSRASGKLGVVVGISGPGAGNMITAIQTSKLEKYPLLVITGDTSTRFINKPAFQAGNKYGTNDDKVFKLVSKFSERVWEAKNLKKQLIKAIQSAMTPPCGPAHLIIPHDIFLKEINEFPEDIDLQGLKMWKNKHSDEIVEHLKEIILGDKKVVIWVGEHLNKKEYSNQITAIAERYNIPVITTYSAKGTIPESHPLSKGSFGYAGCLQAKELILEGEPEIIIGFDVDQNERNTLNWEPKLYQGRKLYLVNFPGSFSNGTEFSFENNPFYILNALFHSLKEILYQGGRRKNWLNALKNRTYTHVSYDLEVNKLLEPLTIVQTLQDLIPANSVLFVDSGSHRLFPGMAWKSEIPDSFFSASVMAPLGWAIAAGIGSTFERKEPVIIFTGDGCMEMHGIEIKTAVKHKKPLLIILNNNEAYGNLFIRYLAVSEEVANLVKITEIDWDKFAESLGAEVYSVRDIESLKHYVTQFLNSPKVMVLNVRTPKIPLIPNGAINTSAIHMDK